MVATDAFGELQKMYSAVKSVQRIKAGSSTTMLDDCVEAMKELDRKAFNPEIELKICNAIEELIMDMYTSKQEEINNSLTLDTTYNGMVVDDSVGGSDYNSYSYRG